MYFFSCFGPGALLAQPSCRLFSIQCVHCKLINLQRRCQRQHGMTHSNPYHPPDTVVAPAPAGPRPYHEQYDGLGGWLILIGIGTILSPIYQIRFLKDYLNDVFVEGGWAAGTTPGGESYHALWAPFIVFETVFSVTSVVVSCCMVYQFFRKKRAFPKWYIWSHVATFVYLIAYSFMLPVLRPDLPLFDAQTRKELGWSVFALAVWVPYMLFSKRVRSTFRR